jgi:hypothetical protein
MMIKPFFVLAFCLHVSSMGQNTQKNWPVEMHDSLESVLNYVNTNRVDDLLEKQKRNNTNTVRVYRVQIYSWNRNGSKQAQERFNEIYPNLKAETSYEQPYFKTKVDAFRTRLIAEKTLKKYKKHFKDAFIFEEYISIDKL